MNADREHRGGQLSQVLETFSLTFEVIMCDTGERAWSVKPGLRVQCNVLKICPRFFLTGHNEHATVLAVRHTRPRTVPNDTHRLKLRM